MSWCLVGSEMCIRDRQNLVHGSDSEESAARELLLWF
jgi:nucleoside diphosphate kinase